MPYGEIKVGHAYPDYALRRDSNRYSVDQVRAHILAVSDQLTNLDFVPTMSEIPWVVKKSGLLRRRFEFGIKVGIIPAPDNEVVQRLDDVISPEVPTLVPIILYHDGVATSAGADPSKDQIARLVQRISNTRVDQKLRDYYFIG